MKLFMNTWANYNEYGADSGITPTGWMSLDEAEDYCEEYAEYEPFINDCEDCPFEINEYSNAESVIEQLRSVEEYDDREREILSAMMDDGYDFEDAVEVIDRGDYYYCQGDMSDFVYQYIDEIGGVSSLGADAIERYFDYEKLGRDLSFDTYEDDNGEEISAEEYWCGDETASDYDIGVEYVNAVGFDGVNDPEGYFDYDAFARDLRFEGHFLETDSGIVEILD